MLSLEKVKSELEKYNYTYDNNILCGHTKSKIKWVLPTGVVNILAFEQATSYLFGFSKEGINFFPIQGDWNIADNLFVGFLAIFVIILIREFMVSGIRMVMADKQVVIAAAKMGKYKTACTMVAIIVLFLSGLHEVVLYIGIALMILACLLTIISGIEYFYKNRKEILESI